MRLKTNPKITPFLWFDGDAEQAARFYVSVFERSRILDVIRFGEAGPGRKGSVMTVAFQLEGQKFVALNDRPQCKFTEAVSFLVDCKSQSEVDYFWKRLGAGGEYQPCGWLKDRYGLSWQIVPGVLLEMLQDEDPQRSRRVMEAMLPMRKIEIRKLKAAYDRKSGS